MVPSMLSTVRSDRTSFFIWATITCETTIDFQLSPFLAKIEGDAASFFSIERTIGEREI